MKKYLLMLCILCSLFKTSGQVRITTFYFDKNGRQPAGRDTLYFRQNTNTAQLYASFYLSDSSIYFQGRIKAISDTSETNNIYLGLCTWYYQNGTIKKECDYRNGLPNGPYAEFYENGSPLKKITYANGILQGPYAEFYQNGRLSRSATYEQGLLHGEYNEYYEDGSISKQALYDKGRITNCRYTEYAKDGSSAHVFSEDFLDNSNSWPVCEDNKVLCKVKIGGLQILNASDKDYSSFIPFTIDSGAFSIETTVNSNYITRNRSVGIIFSFKDWDNYQYFLVSQKTYDIGSVAKGVKKPQLDSAYATELNPAGINKLRLTKANDSLSVYINGCFKARYPYNDTPGDHIGFFVPKNGAALFDNLEVKQYSKQHKPEPVLKETFMLSGKRYPVIIHQSGLIISTKGYVATSLPSVLHANAVLIKAYVNDTVKLLTTSLDLYNAAHNLAVLKINNPVAGKLSDIYYSFPLTDHVPLNAKLTAFYSGKENTSGAYSIRHAEGVLKSYACYENFTNYFESSFEDKSIGQGGAIFTTQGELVGIMQQQDKDVKPNATKSHLLRDLLFNNKEKLEVSREKLEVSKSPKDSSTFMKDIYKNIVEIIVL